MADQLALPPAFLSRLSPELREAYERAAAHVRAPHSVNTEKAYAAAWEAWAKHCERLALELATPAIAAPLPVRPQLLVGWLQLLSDQGAAPNSVRLKLAAVCAIDQGHAAAAGERERLSVRKHPVVQRWLKGWARKVRGVAKKQAPAMAVAQLVHVLERAAEPAKNASRVAHAMRYARDKAILTLGCATGLRASSLAALERSDVELSPRGLIVRVRGSKTDQQGTEDDRKDVLPQARRTICPVEAMDQWLRVRGDAAGALFVGISRAGELAETPLTKGQLERVVSERCRAAGVEGATSHSMRATIGTLSKDRPLAQVMQYVGWKSARTAAGYQRRGKLLDPDGFTAGLFDG